MSPLTVTIIVVAAAILIGVYVSWRAGRLDRLHTRVVTARASLEAALLRRSAVALELAACGLLDPATSLLLAGAAHDARAAGEPNELAESDLTRALRARSEEHTSELQSHVNLVCRLLLEKKNKHNHNS